MLQQELSEIATSSRGMFAHYLNWFTFFVGVNLAGYGWFAKELVNDQQHVARWVILIVCIYFLFQHVVAFIASNALIAYLTRARERMSRIVTELDRQSPTGLPPEVGCPNDLYERMIRLARTTYPSMIFLWIAFTLFAFLR